MSKKRQLSLQDRIDQFWESRVQRPAIKAWRHFTKYILRRGNNLRQERGLVFIWFGLIVILIVAIFGQTSSLSGVFTHTIPASGGTWRDGMMGQIGNLNPLFASTSMDNAAAAVLYDGIMKYEDHKLVPSLAKSVDTSDDGLIKTIKLRQDVKWHDDRPFTAKDVEYTIKIVQDPATGSPFGPGWQGVKVTTPDKFTVTLKLPMSFASFDSALTMPILPEHILSSIANSQLRTAQYNSSPIGTGPFIFHSSYSKGRTQTVDFTRNNNYFGGSVRLQSLSIVGYEDTNNLIEALESRYLTSAVIPNPKLTSKLADSNIVKSHVPLDKVAYVFFKNSIPPFKEKAVRQALSFATNQDVLVNVDEVNGIPLRTPLLPGQLGYDAHTQFKTDVKAAKKLLDKAGWKLNKQGIRQKSGRQLTVNLTTSDDEDYQLVAKNLKKQWGDIGVDVEIKTVPRDQFQQNVLMPHNYEALLYALSVGIDPDEYAYWHSSQAGSGQLNFSEYRSTYIDSLLDGGRTRLNEALRLKKYQSFATQFIKDVPAITLYRLSYEYVYYKPAHGVNLDPQPDASNRYDSIMDWAQRVKSVNQTP